MSDDTYLTRVAIHGSISPKDVPSDTEVTNEEQDAIVEVLFVREEDEYRVLSRHNQTLYLDHGSGPFHDFANALEAAIETARSESFPLLQRVYSWVPATDADGEPGADRIPIPWAEDDEK